jgi:hypothetical protein
VASQKVNALGLPTFNSNRQNQRAALLLGPGNNVYVSFGGYMDRATYHGFIFSFDSNLNAKAVFQSSPSNGAGIWMAGAGPAADSQSVYAITANGATAPPPNAANELGQSFVRLNAGNLSLASWFIPGYKPVLDRNDGDLGSSGPLLIPGTNLLVGGGKEGRVFLLDRSNLGGFRASTDTGKAQLSSDPQVAQRFFVNGNRCDAGKLASSDCWHIHGSPVFWNGPMGAWLYYWTENDFLRAFKFDTGRNRFACGSASNLTCAAVSVSNSRDPDNVEGGTHGMPGGFLSLSANGKTAGSGIIWATHSWHGNANQAVTPGVLRAYDASDLSRELWNSMQVPARDDLGPFAKTVPPTIANGRVYAASAAFLRDKVTLADNSSVGPALSAGPGGLYLGWTGTDNRLNLLKSADGRTFGGKRTLGDTSDLGPALAGDGGQLFLAWIGRDGDGHLNVMRSSDGQTFGRLAESRGGAPAVIPFPETSDTAVGLAVGGGKVFIAWRGVGNRQINIMWAATTALSFSDADKTTLAETTNVPPALTFTGNGLFLSWTGDDGRLNVAPVNTTAAHAVSLGTKKTIGDTAVSGPALVGFPRAGASAPDLELFWGGTDGDNTLNVRTADGANVNAFNYKLTFKDQSAVRPAAALFNRRLFLAFRGNDGAHSLNVARFSPGELEVYGLLP